MADETQGIPTPPPEPAYVSSTAQEAEAIFRLFESGGIAQPAPDGGEPPAGTDSPPSAEVSQTEPNQSIEAAPPGPTQPAAPPPPSAPTLPPAPSPDIAALASSVQALLQAQQARDAAEAHRVAELQRQAQEQQAQAAVSDEAVRNLIYQQTDGTHEQKLARANDPMAIYAVRTHMLAEQARQTYESRAQQLEQRLAAIEAERYAQQIGQAVSPALDAALVAYAPPAEAVELLRQQAAALVQHARMSPQEAVQATLHPGVQAMLKAFPKAPPAPATPRQAVTPEQARAMASVAVQGRGAGRQPTQRQTADQVLAGIRAYEQFGMPKGNRSRS